MLQDDHGIEWGYPTHHVSPTWAIANAYAIWKTLNVFEKTVCYIRIGVIDGHWEMTLVEGRPTNMLHIGGMIYMENSQKGIYMHNAMKAWNWYERNRLYVHG